MRYSKKLKILYIIGSVLICCFTFLFSFFLLITYASASTENFDSYSTGDIDSKSSDWIYDSGGH